MTYFIKRPSHKGNAPKVTKLNQLRDITTNPITTKTLIVEGTDKSCDASITPVNYNDYLKNLRPVYE